MEIKWIYWGHISPIWVSVIEKIVNRAKSNDTFRLNELGTVKD